MLNFLAAVSGNGAGGGGSFESIATANGTGSSNTITFSSIPSTYQHLQIRALHRSSDAATTADFYIRVNGSSSSIYAHHNIRGTGAAVSASGSSSVTEINEGITFAATTASNIMGVSIIDIHDYCSSTKNKTIRLFQGRDDNGTLGTVRLSSGLYAATTAISSITFTLGAGNFTTASTFALYGIKGA